MVNEEFSENDASETPEEEPKVHYDVFYRCLRCGTHAFYFRNIIWHLVNLVQ